MTEFVCVCMHVKCMFAHIYIYSYIDIYIQTYIHIKPGSRIDLIRRPEKGNNTFCFGVIFHFRSVSTLKGAAAETFYINTLQGNPAVQSSLPYLTNSIWNWSGFKPKHREFIT